MTETGFTLDQDFFDETLSKEGVWVDFFGGSSLKLAAFDNAAHSAARAKMARKHRLQLDQTNESSPELVLKITCECMARHVLLDWRKINMGNETDVPYTVERGILALTKSQKLREFVTEQAGLASNFQVKEVVAPVVAEPPVTQVTQATPAAQA